MAWYLAVLEYDGTDFAGSQVQPGERTVQGELGKTLSALAGSRVPTVFAGRTDAGVHAAGQVAGFWLDWTRGSDRLADAITALSPPDVSVPMVATVPEGFNPRFWAQRRRYRYRILVGRRRSALWERWAYQVPFALNLEAMRSAGSRLIGRHDFGGFGRPPRGDNTWRTVSRLDVEVTGSLIQVTVEADAFLRRMVRLLVGVLVDVGRGRKAVADIEGLLERSVPGPISSAVPAKGLTLEAVAYDRARLGWGEGVWWSNEPLGSETGVISERGVRL